MIKKIIIRLPNWIGDAVMATPVLSDLRKWFPEAQITLMCLSPIHQLFEQDPSIDEIFTFTRRQNEHHIIEKIKHGRYDLGILLTNSFSSAWWFWQGKVSQRLGYGGNWRSLLLNDRVAMKKTKHHQVDFYKYLLRPLGIPESQTSPRLYVSKIEESDAMEILHQMGYQSGLSLIGINPKAAFGNAKCWPLERFRALADRLMQDSKVFVVFFGDGANASEINQICKGLPNRVINLAGMTNLRELIAIIKNCDVLVTNDSGPMHIAAAVETPVVALFGSTDDETTGPWNQRDAIIHKHVSCSPCFKRTCPYDFRCMNQIQVDEVVAKISEKKKQHDICRHV